MVELPEFPSRTPIALGDLSVDQLFAYGDIWASVADEEQVGRVLNHVEDAALRSFIQARLLVSQKKYEEALVEYHKGLPLWPSNSGARYLMGYASERVGDFDAAVEHYRESIRKAPEARHAGIALIELLLAQNQFDAAKGVLTVHVDKRPYDITALRYYIAMALRMGQIGSMDKAREKLLSLRGGDDIGMADYVKDLFEHFGFEQALHHMVGSAHYQRIEGYPLTLEAWCEILVRSGRSEEALSLASSVVDKRPQLGEAQAVKAAVLASLNRIGEAKEAYRSALMRLPDHYTSLVALAELEREAGNAEVAIALYKQASDSEEDKGGAAYEAAVLIGMRSDPSLGGERLTEARLRDLLDEHPRFAPAAVDLARAALKRGDSSDKVLDHASRGLRFRPGAETAELVALVRLARGEYEEAANLMYWAIEQGVDRGESYFHLGRALASMGDLEAARGALARALELGPFENIDAARTELQRLGKGRAEEG
jgi:tetratricopeptide (TPR) repeat protein